MLEGGDDGEEKPTKAELEARAQMLRNARHTHALALKAQAELDRRKQQAG
jgi:N-acyl-D-aspartate/D-glutamate deacylase